MAVTWDNTAKAGRIVPGLRRKTASLVKILTVSLAFWGMLGLLGLSACTNSGPAKPQPSKTAAPATPQVQETWPLTGLPRAEVSPHPAVAVKVENTVAARPQSGLEAADMVFEEQVEGGLTRFNAVFHSQLPEEIGPIRSVRPMDTAIAGQFGAMLVYSGGVAQFEEKVAAAGLHGFNEDQALGASYRVNWRRMPHNLYLSIPKLFEKVGQQGLDEPPTIFDFAQKTDTPSAARGQAASHLSMTFPSLKVEYSWNGKRWERSDGGVKSTARTGQILQSDNVVALVTKIVDTSVRDSAGFPVPETILTGGGKAYVASAGKVAEVTWAKDSDGSPLLLSDASGAPVVLNPGTTWVELLTSDTFAFD